MRKKKGPNFKHSEKTKEKMSKVVRRKYRCKPITEDKRKEMSDRAKARPRRKHTIETKRNIKEGLAKFKESDRYNSYIEDLSKRGKENYKIHGNAHLIKAKQEKYTSSLEIKFKDFLIENSIVLEHQYISDVWTYDFYLPDLNMLVETDGEYWHNKSLNQINRDIRKHKNAVRNGFSICRILDIDWQPEKIFIDKEFLINESILILSERKRNYIGKIDGDKN